MGYYLFLAFLVAVIAVGAVSIYRSTRRRVYEQHPELKEMEQTISLYKKHIQLLSECMILVQELTRKLDEGIDDRAGLFKLQELVAEILKIDRELRDRNPKQQTNKKFLEGAFQILELHKDKLKQ